MRKHGRVEVVMGENVGLKDFGDVELHSKLHSVPARAAGPIHSLTKVRTSLSRNAGRFLP